MVFDKIYGQSDQNIFILIEMPSKNRLSEWCRKESRVITVVKSIDFW